VPETGSAPATRSYHGQPVLKEPTWTWEIPCYFFTGGLGGAAAGLSFVAGLRGNEELARRGWLVSLSALAVSPVFLISDLGRPARFLNMLRMFKVTSPMSVGSWILSVSGASTAAACADAFGLPIPGGRVARPVAAVFGLPLSTYTAALIANTAVPVWHEARRELPFVFAAGAAASAGAAAAAATPASCAAPARRLAVAGGLAELALERAMESRLGFVGEPYGSGAPHALAWASRAATAAGAGLLGLAGARSRPAAVAGGLLMCAGALAARWSIYKAGFASAADPAYVVGPQRARVAATA
jgi:DMSO reductase anchor subunit